MPHSAEYKKFAVAIPPADAAMAKAVMEMYTSNTSKRLDALINKSVTILFWNGKEETSS